MGHISLKPHAEIDELIASINQKQIILHNDDINSFEHVIMTLINYCDHSPEQAEQCAFIVHHNGKCGIKTGSIDKLKPIYQALLAEDLTVTIQ